MSKLAALLDGVSRADLARRSAAITQAYRAGAGSESAVRDRLDALAYATARMPATRAAVSEALSRLIEAAPDFNPASLLDLGCGCGAASLAARDAFPSLARLTLVDRNAAMLTLARELLDDDVEPGALSLDLRRAADAPRADLVILAYVQVEMEEADACALAHAAYERAREALVLVEPGTPAGFARLRAARAALIEAGAHIAAPCPHALACPIRAPDWRHFSVRVQRSRDHLAVKGADVPYEDEPFIYLALTRTPCPPARARVIASPRRDKTGVTARLCTPQGEARDMVVAARDKTAIRAVRRIEEGDLWPL
jgi:ribosomal protein RSM22 (predicted rRNA methylase)